MVARPVASRVLLMLLLGVREQTLLAVWPALAVLVALLPLLPRQR